MSGHKRATVSINQQELQRLKEASQRLNQVEKDYEEIRLRVQERRQEDSIQFIEQVVHRQDDFQQALGSVNFDVQALEWHTSQALIDQAENVSLQVQLTGSEIWDNTQTLVLNHIQSINEVIEENQSAHLNHFNALQSELHSIVHDRGSRRELALQTLLTAQSYLNAIQDTYPHQQFYPDALQNLYSELEAVQMNFENQFYEAALLGAQQTCRNSAILRLSLEEQIQKSNLLLNMIYDQVNFLSEYINNHNFVNAIDLDGNVLDTQVDVNFWTDESLSALIQEFHMVEMQLRQPEIRTDFERLLNIQNESLPQILTKLDDIIFQARVNILSSQLRMNIAEKIINALNHQGFEIQDSGYETYDQRNPFIAHLKAFDGTEVYIRIDPKQNSDQQQIHIQSNDTTQYSDTEARYRARAIFKSLQESGLSIGNMQIARQPLIAEPTANYLSQPRHTVLAK